MKLFNTSGQDNKESRQIWGGNTTNLIQLNEVKFDWAVTYYKQMEANFWLPEKVNLVQDQVDYNNLTKEERRAYNGIIGYLIFLDSLQVANLGNISSIMTAPEVKIAIANQQYQEANHSRSYQTILEAIVDPGDREGIYNYWRSDSVLKARCEYIASLYQNYADSLDGEDYFYAVVANYLLEGMYFWTGFQFFFNLASRNMMVGTSDMVRYIKKDEAIHIKLFQKLIPEAMKNFSWSEEKVLTLVDKAVEQEIQWNNHIMGSDILGLTPQANEQYIKHLADLRLKGISITPLYGEPENPYRHLELSSEQGNTKGNFFESTVTEYTVSTAINGWDF